MWSCGSAKRVAGRRTGADWTLLPQRGDVGGIPAWLPYSIRGTTTSAGQPLTEAFSLARSSAAVVATGVNCAPAADTAAALALNTGLPGVVYPNGGGTWAPNPAAG